MNSLAKRRRFSLLVVIMLLLSLLGATTASAAASTVTVSQSFPIQLWVFVSCANGGAGELVELSGNLHEVFHITYDSGGGFHLVSTVNPQGISGVGLSTGAMYQGTGGTRDIYNAAVGGEETYVNNFKIIGQGQGNNFLVHSNFHITVHADGTVSAYHDNFSVECK